MHAARLQAGMMHVKLVRAHEQDTMPAMQTDGSQKYPVPWDMPNQKKSGKRCQWARTLLSSERSKLLPLGWKGDVGCHHKTYEKSGVLWISVKPDWQGLFLWMLMSQAVAALSKVMQNRERGRTTTPEHTNPLYMRIAIISLTVLENSGFLWAENSHSQLGVLQEEFVFCILSVSIFLTVTWPSRPALNQSRSRGWQSHFVLLWLTPFNRALNRIWVLTRN